MSTNDPSIPHEPSISAVEAAKSDYGTTSAPTTAETVVPDRLDGRYQTTKWEVWAYYAWVISFFAKRKDYD